MMTDYLDAVFPMSVPTQSLRVGGCYVTAGADVLKILAFDGSFVMYVVRRNGVFPAWNKRWWLSMTREDFVREVISEVPCERSSRLP
jgi:hypothetical protein